MSASEAALQAALEAELAALQLRERELAEAAAAQSPDEAEESFPRHILPPSTPELAQMSALWARFTAWINAEGASDALKLNPPTSVRDFFTLQRSIAPEGLSEGEFELPVDVAASFAAHDGQDWSSVTGLMGRFYLLDAAAAYGEWRDQVDMVEMGLYSDPKYQRAKKAFGSHARIDTNSWFNRGWLPIACSGGRGLGGDLICVDLVPHRALHRGQVILYRPESAERFVLADSMADWLTAVVTHLEQGVYRFDTARATYVAGKEPENKQADGAANGAAGSDGAAAGAAAAASSSSRSALPTSASPTIGVHAFLYSSLECRDFFIQNRTEELVFLSDNDFGLLNTDSLTEEATKAYAAAAAGLQ